MKNSKIKIIVLGDGMADAPDGARLLKTPLAEAKTPVIDALIKRSAAGLVRTVPLGMKPGSDIANLSVMGYDPSRYYTGRSPLEAVSIGIAMDDDDLALRCNLVTLSADGDTADGIPQRGIDIKDGTALSKQEGSNSVIPQDGIDIDGTALSNQEGSNSVIPQGGINIKDGAENGVKNGVNQSAFGEKPQDGKARAFGEKTMLDYSAGEISTEEAHILIADFAKYLKSLRGSKNCGIVPRKISENPENAKNAEKNFQNITHAIKNPQKNDGIEPSEKLAAAVECFTFYGGVSYRNCLIIKNGASGTVCTPPHDISGKKIREYLPRGVYGEVFTEIIEASYQFLSKHEINKRRIQSGKNPANSVWLWGEGKKPLLDDFYKLNGKKGAVISAVDLIKGIGLAANMKIYEVEGATGTLETNFDGKAKAVIDAVSEGCGFVYLHIEAADECGHHGDREGKIRSIEKIDWVIGYIKNALDEKRLGYSLMILPDHPTPVSILTHSAEPVPYMIFDSEKNLSNGVTAYDETAAEKGEFVESGPALLKKFLEI
jgi:2,3-bisphosphoglycerate-independent phosphoglycerate mutase